MTCFGIPVRYRLKKLEEGTAEGPERQAAHGAGRLRGGSRGDPACIGGRPAQARQIYELLVQDHGHGGNY